MSLSAALNSARTSLAATASQTAVISRNITGASDPFYSRKAAIVSTSGIGAVQLVSVERAANTALFFNMLDATSVAAGQQALVSGLDLLEGTVGDPGSDQSPAAMLGKLRNAIQQYATAPDDPILAQSVLNSAGSMASALNTATTLVSQAREQADADIAGSVSRINAMLADFEKINSEIVNGTFAGADVTDNLDARDKILAKLSEEIGIRVVTRANNDAVIYTDGGVTLFETRARAVTFQPTTSFSAATTGNAVYVDGVPVTGPNASMPLKSGRIQGLATFRDDVSLTYQRQLDEVARGLIEVFAETDQNDPATLPPAAGLFTYSGAPALPASGVALPGLAGDIRVNPNADPDQGGVLERLRDGGISDPGNPAFNYNPTGATGFTGRLQGILDELSRERLFDPASGADPTNNLIGFASSSISWLEAGRKDATTQFEYRSTLLERTSEALSNATGVNLEEEMTVMLELERSYQASAKLIATVDQMLASLMAAV
jgi:flagellar hook-associated protein 1